ncbi:MAG: hypothetical protein ACYSUL_05230 [Planctomycetota bacterium]
MVLVLVGIVIGLVISQSGNRLVQDAKAAGGKVESPTGHRTELFIIPVLRNSDPTKCVLSPWAPGCPPFVPSKLPLAF